MRLLLLVEGPHFSLNKSFSDHHIPQNKPTKKLTMDQSILTECPLLISSLFSWRESFESDDESECDWVQEKKCETLSYFKTQSWRQDKFIIKKSSFRQIMSQGNVQKKQVKFSSTIQTVIKSLKDPREQYDPSVVWIPPNTSDFVSADESSMNRHRHHHHSRRQNTVIGFVALNSDDFQISASSCSDNSSPMIKILERRNNHRNAVLREHEWQFNRGSRDSIKLANISSLHSKWNKDLACSEWWLTRL